MPAAERDSFEFTGSFFTDDQEFFLTQDESKVLTINTKELGEKSYRATVDLLREEKEEVSSEIWGNDPSVPGFVRHYLIELEIRVEDKNPVFYYEILEVSKVTASSSISVTNFEVQCNSSIFKFARDEAYVGCVFDNYNSVRSAALETLAWYDDRRMPLALTPQEYTRSKPQFEQSVP
ncbi:hypothetical protein [Erythrobacter oryzae]|uniref:hypothetical protein n=1 Tax=Erythrobacter oryzae TaxID=3019556 RepID=UPI0025548A1D|nr:hypothetical protein [Erythrobacter sp. COR-2]